MRQKMFYSIKDELQAGQIARLCLRMDIQAKALTWADYDRTVGEVAGIALSGKNPIREKKKIPLGYQVPDIMIFCGMPDGSLDRFLSEYRKEKIAPVPLKAVVTPYNVSWTIYELILELGRERAAVLEQRKKG